MCKKYAKCSYCYKQVNMTRFLFPGWHICAYTEEERNEIDRDRWLTHEYLTAGSPFLGSLGNYEDQPRQPQF